MTYDTTKDPRIIAAHLACTLLKKSVKQKPGTVLKISRDRLTEPAAACDSAVMTMMYMYQDPETLASSEPVKNLLAAVETLTEAYEKLIADNDDRSMLRANIRWCLRTLSHLPERFGNPGATLASGVDLVAVKVRHVKKSGNFLNTRVTDGKAEYDVVTNLTSVATGSVLAAAFLPPREIGGTVSEAMFLGGEKRTEAPGTIFAEDQVDAKEAAGILYDEVAKQHKG
jgi:predicted RNA-binding protein with EMAP domain